MPTSLAIADEDTRFEGDDVRARFEVLAKAVLSATALSSSYDDIAGHPLYRQIIEMGPAVVPLLIERLRRAPEPWFFALTAITGHDPLLPSDRGRPAKMAARWLAWANAERG